MSRVSTARSSDGTRLGRRVFVFHGGEHVAHPFDYGALFWDRASLDRADDRERAAGQGGELRLSEPACLAGLSQLPSNLTGGGGGVGGHAWTLAPRPPDFDGRF